MTSMHILAVHAAVPAHSAEAHDDHGEAWRVRFDVNLGTTANNRMGSFVVRVFPSWAPHGAARFKELVQYSIVTR